MIDKAMYVAMTGASATMKAQASVSHNLANANTVGFQATLAGTVAAPVAGEGHGSRVAVSHRTLGVSAAPGAINATGNTLDVALDQERWLAVQTPGGETAYTRAGDLKLSPNGLLTTASGLSVLDQQGAPIAIPPHESLHIGGDGTISIVPLGEPEANIGEAGRLQVVAARTDELVRGDDGLMRLPPGAEPLPPAAGKVLTAGALEQSNADPTASLVSMIQLSRQFEMQVRVLQSGDENAQASNSLLSSR
ncbi:flagellar basal-body rod protein FlgF [Lysobacter spongiicola DSM 21749]|uniref:Flagellar basal-body rod protein FlgF n=1 Tax=Lysobacter spongiicola DSM 21749 TaxID=1122188 RepID=A0A1T4S0B1_9GAMM|nr:flagellar basal-body rod protein FlgF [Lysobacter spongiicola DSM 21749]